MVYDPFKEQQKQTLEGKKGAPVVFDPFDPSKRIGGIIEQAKPSKDFMEKLTRREDGIDYELGAPASLRAGFSLMDTPEEKANFLSKRVGKDNWGLDKFGAYVIKPGGMEKFGVKTGVPVALDEHNFTKRDLADLAQDAPSIGAMLIAAPLTGGMSIPFAMGFIGLMGAGARGYTEVAESLAGENLQDREQIEKMLRDEFSLAAVGEGSYRLAARPLGRKLMAPHAKRMTPIKQQAAREALEMGAKPKATLVTGAPITGRIQGMIENVLGDVWAPHNANVLRREMARLREAAGIATGRDIASSIRGVKAGFMGEAHGKAKLIDEMVGGNPVIPIGRMKKVATDLLDEMPKAGGEPSQVFALRRKFLEGIIKLDDKQSLVEMQTLRNILFDAMHDPDLLPGIQGRIFGKLYKSANQTYDDAVRSGDLAPQAKVAIDSFKGWYKTEIRKFDDAIINRLARKPGEAGAIDPDMVTSTIFKKGRPKLMGKVMRVVDDETKQDIRRRAMEEVLDSAIDVTAADPLTEVFTGGKLLKALNSYGKPTLSETFGTELTNDLYRLGRVLAVTSRVSVRGGQLVGANIALHPIKKLPKLLQLGILGGLMGSQPGLRLLTTGLLPPKTLAGKAAVGTTAATARLTAYLTTVADLEMTGQETGIPSGFRYPGSNLPIEQ